MKLDKSIRVPITHQTEKRIKQIKQKSRKDMPIRSYYHYIFMLGLAQIESEYDFKFPIS